MSGKVLLEKLSFPKKILFIFSLLIGICFWSNLALDINPWGTRWAYPLVFIYCLILLFDKSTEWKSYKWEFAGVLKWTIITMFLSFIPAYIDWNQSILLSLQASIKYTWILFIYFILRRWSICTSYIMKYIIILSIIWVIIEIGQQFTYPNYWFTGRPDEGYGIAERMGLYRFYIWGVDFVMIAFAYCVGLLAQRENKFSINLLCLGTIFLIGLLCYCSRKHIYVSLLTIGIVSLLIKSKYRNLIRFVFALLVFAIIYNFYADFAEMNEQSIEAQGEGEDFIRFLALDYYLFKFSDSPLYFWLLSILIYLLTERLNFAIDLILASAGAFCALGVWFFLKGYRKGMAVRLMNFVRHIPGLKRWARGFIDKHKEQLDTIDRQIAALHNQNPKTFVSAVLLELACRVCSALEIMFILFVLPGIDVTFTQCILILAFTSLFANLLFFLPLQLGGREGGFIMSTAGLALSAGAGIFVALIVRVRELVWTAIGLLMINIEKRHGGKLSTD